MSSTYEIVHRQAPLRGLQQIFSRIFLTVRRSVGCKYTQFFPPSLPLTILCDSSIQLVTGFWCTQFWLTPKSMLSDRQRRTSRRFPACTSMAASPASMPGCGGVLARATKVSIRSECIEDLWVPANVVCTYRHKNTKTLTKYF